MLSTISEGSRQQGPQYAQGSYINSIICQQCIVNDETIEIES